MQKSMEKTIKKMRSGSIVGQVFLFLFSLCGSAFIIVILIVAFTVIALYGRYTDSFYSSEKTIEGIKSYKQSGKDYDSIMTTIQLEEKRPLSVSIVDKKDKVIAHYGEKINLKEATVFSEKDEPAIRVTFEDIVDENDGADISVNIARLAGDFYKNGHEDSSYSNMNQLLQSEVYTKCYWINAPLEDDNTAYVKNELIIYGKDCMVAFAIAALLGIVFILSSIGGLVRAISGIISQRYYLKLLLSDPITGGNNEFAFEQNAYKNITRFYYRKNGFAVIDLSLEKYQNYCTLYGVEEGEKLLQIINRTIRTKLVSGETVSRVSGGNYLILLRTYKDAIDEKSLTLKAKTIIESIPSQLSSHSDIQGLNNIHLKAGLYYLVPVTDEESRKRREKGNLNITNLCIKAGIAKSAITEDSGFMVYNHDMWEKEIWERKVEDMMEDALANEEFQVYIQPKYHPSTEELLGGEALVRWISPTEGFISPGQFIPIFERTGFVTKLDDYMISHTAKLQADWLAAGKKIVPISVNVSRAHFAQPDLAEHIRDLVSVYPLPNKYIEIELTESAFFDDKNALLTTVHRLQEYGFEVSMDDFGSGYSSLNSLKDLPLNVLKLDAEFFRGDDFGGRGEIVVSEAISLAKKLDMRIVAEGVEKKEQVDFLADQNCDMIQGYYFAKPMPSNEYEERMSNS